MHTVEAMVCLCQIFCKKLLVTVPLVEQVSVKADWYEFSQGVNKYKVSSESVLFSSYTCHVTENIYQKKSQHV